MILNTICMKILLNYYTKYVKNNEKFTFINGILLIKGKNRLVNLFESDIICV